uniref:ceramide glucosyltransferase n=1 Tax=Timema tahoe TaxID=61484 RepID=A0A7R9FF04_9NEOP|nr:unnamed protein product [Timema tahoe]
MPYKNKSARWVNGSHNLTSPYCKDRLPSSRLPTSVASQLTGTDFFLRGMLKSQVYATRPRTIQELKEIIVVEFEAIQQDTLLTILCQVSRRWKLHKKMTPLSPEAPYPGVSILKPLMGVDPNLFTNLESFFTMNYPLFEVLLCVEDESDPAIMLVRSLMKKYPNVDSRLFTGGASVGVNPKINNMYPGYMAAKYDMLLISDSGIRMKEDTLLDMVLHMTEFIGLVHQMPFTCDRKGFAATLEKIYFGTAQARIYLSADFLGIICHTGMSTLMRKSLIDDVGGLAKFGCYLAEDFFFAKSLTNRGWKMRISSQPAWQNSGLCEISSFQARLTRWAKLRVAMVPFTIILEPLSECMVLGAFASWAVSFLFNWDPLSFYLVHILLWFICDWILISIVQNGSLPFNKFDFVVGWLFRECSSLYLFLRFLLPFGNDRKNKQKLEKLQISDDLIDATIIIIIIIIINNNCFQPVAGKYMFSFDFKINKKKLSGAIISFGFYLHYVDVPGYDHHAFTNCSASMAEAKVWQFQRTSNFLTSTLKTVVGGEMSDVVSKEEIQATWPQEGGKTNVATGEEERQATGPQERRRDERCGLREGRRDEEHGLRRRGGTSDVASGG